jgi:hypothetical protein
MNTLTHHDVVTKSTTPSKQSSFTDYILLILETDFAVSAAPHFLNR